MDTRQIFALIKSRCDTPAKRRAYNELVSIFRAESPLDNMWDNYLKQEMAKLSYWATGYYWVKSGDNYLKGKFMTSPFKETDTKEWTKLLNDKITKERKPNGIISYQINKGASNEYKSVKEKFEAEKSRGYSPCKFISKSDL